MLVTLSPDAQAIVDMLELMHAKAEQASREADARYRADPSSTNYMDRMERSAVAHELWCALFRARAYGAFALRAAV